MTAQRRAALIGAMSVALAAVIGGSASAASASAAPPTFSCKFEGTGALSAPSPFVTGNLSESYMFSASTGSPLLFDCVTSDGSGVSIDRLYVTSTGAYYDGICGNAHLSSWDSMNSVTAVHLGGTEDLSGDFPLDDFGYEVENQDPQFFFTNPAFTAVGVASSLPTGDALDATSGNCTTHFILAGSVAGTINSDPV